MDVVRLIAAGNEYRFRVANNLRHLGIAGSLPIGMLSVATEFSLHNPLM